MRVSRERASERRSREGQRKGELATISHKFSFVLRSDEGSLRASSPIWVSEVSLARTRERGAPRGFAARSRVLARLASLAQIGELARRPGLVLQCSSVEDRLPVAITNKTLYVCPFRHWRVAFS